MGAGSQDLRASTVCGQRALALVKIYSALVSNLCSNDEGCSRWISSLKQGLGGTPALLLQSEGGMAKVLSYLQGMGDVTGS
jgi:hypothetical protein